MGIPVKEPPKKDSSISDMFIFDRVDMYSLTVLCISDGVSGFEWAVILRWLQKTHSLLHPLCGMNMGMMAWSFMLSVLFLYYGAYICKTVFFKVHDIKAAALDKITDPCIIAVSGDISVKDHGAADFSGGSA